MVRTIQHRLVQSAAVVMFGTSMAVAQKHTASFGRISELTINMNISGILAADFRGDGTTDVAAYGMGQVAILTNDASGELALARTVRSLGQINRILSADLNRDRFSDLIITSANPRSVRVYVGGRDTFQLRWNSEISPDAENVLIEDLNNDRKPDLVFFGRKMLGLMTLLGHGDGNFGPQKMILEEFSLIDLIIRDLNGDGIMDIAGFDWVNNQLLVFSGIGKLRFSEPSVTDLPSEVIEAGVGLVNSDINPDLVALMKDPQELVVYLGDGLGGFVPTFHLPLNVGGQKLILRDVDKNGRSDAIIFSRTDRSFSVLLSKADGTFNRSISYAAGAHPDELIAFYNPRLRETSIAVLDRAARAVSVYRSIPYAGPPLARHSYALGPRPEGITSVDINHDLFNDLLVTNSGTNHVSLFINRRDGTFDGQIPIPAKAFGGAIAAERKNDSTVACVIVHPALEMISLTELVYPSLQSTIVEIPTGNSPELLSMQYGRDSHLFTLLASTKDTASGTRSISLMRQVDNTHFVEETFFASRGQPILAADVCDVNRDGLMDVAYFTFDPARRRLGLNTALGRSDNSFDPPRQNFSLPDTGLYDVRVWSARFNGDTTVDLVMHSAANNGYLSFAYGTGDSGFILGSQRFSEVITRARTDIELTDMDGNGLTDLVVANALRNMIQVYLRKTDGTFLEPRRVVSWPDGGGFIVAELNNDGVKDCAIIDSESGIMRVFLGSE